MDKYVPLVWEFPFSIDDPEGDIFVRGPGTEMQ